MGTSAIATSLGKLTNNASKLIGTLQTGVNKVLWGQANTQPVQTTTYNATSGSFTATTTPTTPTVPTGNLVQSGLFNALDVLNEVDLCNVLSYLTDNISIKKKPRPDKPWNATQTALYTL